MIAEYKTASGDNLNYVRCKTRKSFRYRIREYTKEITSSFNYAIRIKI